MRKKEQFALHTRSDTNQPVQSQKQARSSKFWIKEEEGLCYLCSKKKKKTLISCAITEQLICAFVFAYECCWFTYAAAQKCNKLSCIDI